jgi:endonuclease/exonuclease/phosphatase family metal-dependent hydrolase
VLRLASYNIHAAVGTDGRQDIGRIAAVIEEISPDLIGLQEVESRGSRARADQAERLAARLGMTCVEGPMLLEGSGWFGNAILSRLPVEDVQQWRFADHSREPRGAIAVLVRDPGGVCWQIVNTHLDLRARYRLRQAKTLRHLLAPMRPAARALLGDLNEWRPRGPTLARLRQLGAVPRAPGTFPSWWPVFPLDRMVLKGCRPQSSLRRHLTRLSRRASDHLPIVADLVAETEAGSIDQSDGSASPALVGSSRRGRRPFSA